MDYALALFAGLIQGLTEFLPVSSTGHLIIFQKLFNLSPQSFGLAFDASLHLGTLTAVLAYFFKDYIKSLSSKKFLLALIVGTIPAVIFGFLFEGIIENSIRQLWIIGLALIAFSFVMLAAERVGKRKKDLTKLSLKEALIVGLAQALALIPGISRSGSTISAGLFLGFTREESARFAFMLSGPIIAGAGMKKFLEVLTSQESNYDIKIFLIGMLSSAIFGYLTIKYFLSYLNKRGLIPFVIYRIVVGIVLVLISIKA